MSTVYSEIVQILHRFFFYLDAARYDAMLSLLEDDAVWHRQGRVLRGHAETLAALQERSSTIRIRHLVTNTFLDKAAPGENVTVRSYMTVYRADDGKPPKPPVAIKGPASVLVVTATLRKRDGSWKIVELNTAPEFVVGQRSNRTVTES